MTAMAVNGEAVLRSAAALRVTAIPSHVFRKPSGRGTLNAALCAGPILPGDRTGNSFLEVIARTRHSLYEQWKTRWACKKIVLRTRDGVGWLSTLQEKLCRGIQVSSHIPRDRHWYQTP
ncbi:hypothetical protein EV561_1197 [Rhizobium sp. BK376]|nr:hypothetical protein EV561_1197 [Rhizobium sp. BK376]